METGTIRVNLYLKLALARGVSMKSGLGDRNNNKKQNDYSASPKPSQ